MAAVAVVVVKTDIQTAADAAVQNTASAPPFVNVKKCANKTNSLWERQLPKNVGDIVDLTAAASPLVSALLVKRTGSNKDDIIPGRLYRCSNYS